MASSKFMLLLWLNLSIVICLIYVQYVSARGPEKLAKRMKVRHRTEKGTALDTAWYPDEIKDALTEMGFDHTRCAERHWKNYVRESDRGNDVLRRAIRRLCTRLLIPNDADRLGTYRKYLAQVGKKHKLEELTKLLLGKLSGYNETRERFLDDQKFVIDESSTDCYWKTYYAFARTCADPCFDWRTQDMRHIWANACKAQWLNIEKIKECFTEVCSDFPLYSHT